MHQSPPARWLFGGAQDVVPRSPWEHRAVLPRHDESWRVSHLTRADDVYSRNRIAAQPPYYGY